MCRPVLSLPRKDLHWRLATDASNVAMGAVLSQYDNDNVEHPIGFYSRKLNDSETRWVIWELELGAVVWASTLCRPYLRAVHFELVTDSKVVAALLVKEVPPRRENFIIRMSEFNFTVVHRKGELNRNADFFSRWAKYKEYEEQTKLKIQCLNCVVLQGMQEWLEQHKRVRPDRRLRTRSIRRYGKDLEELTPQQLDELTIKPCADTTDTDEEHEILQCFPLNVEAKPVLRGEALLNEKHGPTVETRFEKGKPIPELIFQAVPDKMDAKRIRATIIEEQRKDPFLKLIIEKLQSKYAVEGGLERLSASKAAEDLGTQVISEAQQDTGENSREKKEKWAVHLLQKHKQMQMLKMSKQTKKRRTMKTSCTGRRSWTDTDSLVKTSLVKECPYKTAKKKEMTVAWPIVVPESMIPTILSLFHGDTSILRHGGKHKTYGAMRFVWKGMVQAVRQWISACHKCCYVNAKYRCKQDTMSYQKQLRL